jgi:hypothetical protein
MKNKCVVHHALAAALLLAGCASRPKEKPVHQRGWIGGRYERATTRRSLSDKLFGADHTIYSFPPALTNARDTGILTVSLGTNTPAYLAGLREGDLILELGHQPAADLPGFSRIITASQPGASLPVKAFRDGQMMECNVTVGREKFREQGTLAVGLPGFLEPLHLVPSRAAPWFSLGPLGYEKNDDAPVEFASVKERYKQSCHPKGQQTGYDEDWRFWLAIMELKKGKTILAQEPAAGPPSP